MDWKTVGEKVVVGVVTAIVLGAGALAWNFTSDGGLIRLLGGVPEKDLSPQLALLREKISDLENSQKNKSAAEFPANAVVAFNSKFDAPCPQGWTFWEPSIGRFVVGAGNSRNKDEKGVDLTDRQSFLDHAETGTGGEEKVKLTESEMPKHRHDVFLSDKDGDGEGIDAANNNADAGAASPSRIAEAGGSQPHNNMPPYIALYFCKKD